MLQLPTGNMNCARLHFGQSRRMAIVISTFSEFETKPIFIDCDNQLYACVIG